MLQKNVHFAITNHVQFQWFFEIRKGFGFPNSCRKTVPGIRGPAISKARSPILVLVPGTKTSDEFDDRPATFCSHLIAAGSCLPNSTFPSSLSSLAVTGLGAPLNSNALKRRYRPYKSPE